MRMKAFWGLLMAVFCGLILDLNAQYNALTDSSGAANPYGRKYPPGFTIPGRSMENRPSSTAG